MDGTLMDGEVTGKAEPRSRKLDIVPSRDFVGWLVDSRVSLAVTTGAAGRLVLIGASPDGKISVFLRSFDRTHGIHAAGHSLLLGTGFQIWRLENSVAEGKLAGDYDRLYVPRLALTTGDVQAGDVGFAPDGTILFANRMFGCVAAATAEFSFTPAWRPPFVSRIAPEDRCGLSGFALENGLIRFVTCWAASDAPQGWRQRIKDGGVVIDASIDRTVARGFSLPTAPRVHKGQLWMNEAGTGILGAVDIKSGEFEEVAFCPGILGGLAFVGNHAIVTTSIRRDGFAPGDLPLGASLAAYGAEARTAIVVVDLATGAIVHWLRFDGADELRDVAVLPGARRPAAVGLVGDDIRKVLTIGPDASAR
jgi:uncharacterized protein (TIGR03032 family)